MTATVNPVTDRADPEREQVYRLTFTHVRAANVPDVVMSVAIKQKVLDGIGEYRCLRDLIRVHGSRLNTNNNLTLLKMTGTLAQGDENPWAITQIEQLITDGKGQFYTQVQRNLCMPRRAYG